MGEGLSTAYALSLTYCGLRALGVPDLSELPQGSSGNNYDPDLAARYHGTLPPGYADKAFEQGARRRSDEATHDPVSGPGSPANWAFGNKRSNEPLGLLIVSTKTREALDTEVTRLKQLSNDLEWHVEIGYRPRDRREVFGFVDGPARPGIAARLRVSGGNWSGIVPRGASQVFPLSSLLIDTPAPKWARLGSFLVYRRMNQNAQTFRNDIEAAAAATGRTQDEMAHAILGRTRDGVSITRLEMRDGAALPNTEADAVDYSKGRCPAFAHAKKCNPRDEEADPVPLFRRSVVFKDKDGQGAVEEEGLHFFCYQASIGEQYEAVSRWLNVGDKDEPARNVDALLGRPEKCPLSMSREFELDGKKFTLGEFAHTTGGAYLFAPTLSGLHSLLS
jgi:Dyp-type peroxidase family